MTSNANAPLDPETSEESTRRSFTAKATLLLGAAITLVLGVPLAVFSVPGKAINELAGEQWSPLDKTDWGKLLTSDTPVKIAFVEKTQDGYFAPGKSDDYAWGVKMSNAQWHRMKQDRADLFGPDNGAHVAYDDRIYVAGFVIFSSVCPHLGCRYTWVADKKYFFCPCHDSAFSRNGAYVSGPSPRGLDPLPLRERSGNAEITLIRYKTSTPQRIVVSYA